MRLVDKVPQKMHMNGFQSHDALSNKFTHSVSFLYFGHDIPQRGKGMSLSCAGMGFNAMFDL